MSELYKRDEYTDIKVGDLVAIDQISDTARKATQKDKDRVIGVCVEIFEDEILVCNEGMVDVNVTGMVCLGDHLKLSHKDGIADAIPTIQEEDLFDVRSIGKVVYLYDVYSKVKVLLNIK